MNVKELYPNLWPHQVEALEKVVASDKKLIVLIGPPGSGKSLVNMLIAEQYGSSIIMCVTKQLQQQYEDDFSKVTGFEKIMGKNNYPCPLHYTKNVEQSDRYKYCRTCPLKTNLECEYWKLDEATKSSSIVVTNYAYFAMQRWYGRDTHGTRNRACVIFDEAHEFERTMLGLMDAHITPEDKQYVPTLPRTTDLAEWEEWITEAMISVANQIAGSDGSDDDWALKDFESRLQRIRYGMKNGWICNNTEKKAGFMWRPIWVSPDWIKPLTLDAEKIIMSSATIYDPTHLAETMGVSPDDMEVIEMPSTFPYYQRPFIIIPVANVSSWKMSEADQDKLVQAVDRIMDMHPQEKGIIHTVSYKMRDLIVKRSKRNGRFRTHQSHDRNLKIEQFKNDKEPTVLVSPSATTGINIPEIRFQIILKLPIPNLGDERESIRRKERKDIFDAEVGNVLIQTYGRAMRTPTDEGKTYALDRMIKFFYRSHMKHFPQYVREAVVELNHI